MVAATGFQRYGYEKTELVTLFKDVLNSKEKLLSLPEKVYEVQKTIFKKVNCLWPRGYEHRQEANVINY